MRSSTKQKRFDLLPFEGSAPAFDMACLNNLDYMRRLASDSMKLIVTSPPYNIGKAYECRTSLHAYVENQKREIAECARLLHPNGSLCWQVGNHVENGEIFPLDSVLYPVFKAYGLKLRNRIIWHFEHGLHCAKRLSGRYETINWFTKSDEYTFHLDQFACHQNIQARSTSKVRKPGNFRAIPWAKTRATFGYFRT